jgi:hypothetical protein
LAEPVLRYPNGTGIFRPTFPCPLRRNLRHYAAPDLDNRCLKVFQPLHGPESVIVFRHYKSPPIVISRHAIPGHDNAEFPNWEMLISRLVGNGFNKHLTGLSKRMSERKRRLQNFDGDDLKGLKFVATLSLRRMRNH